MRYSSHIYCLNSRFWWCFVRGPTLTPYLFSCMKAAFLPLLFALSAYSAAAQTGTPAFTMTCSEGNYQSGNRKQYCETRDLTLPGTNGKTLDVDGRANGGISVHGYEGTEVRVRVKVTAWDETDAAARQRAAGITITTKNNKLKAESADSREQNWAVSYEIFVPRRTALALNTVNGGIRIDHVAADVHFEAVNGGVDLQELGGNVQGHTVNGGLTITLAGTSWQGQGLDVETTNGGITWRIPANYSAKLYTSTTVGSIKGDLPVTKTGMLSREVATSLGKGGAPVKAVTTNGGIRVQQEVR